MAARSPACYERTGTYRCGNGAVSDGATWQCGHQGGFTRLAVRVYPNIIVAAGSDPMADPPHIVVVEDEATQRQLLVEYLGRQNFRVSGVEGGTALRRLCERELPALVLLDVGLPGEDGFALARWLREKSGRVGIIMVTAATDTVDRVVGLETGADDYVPKPVEMRELLARVKSVLRRATGAAVTTHAPRVRMGRLVLDLDKRVLVDPGDGSEQALTASEFDLLKLFAENPNRPLQRDWLLESAAHREMEAFDRAIDLRITRLRRKIEHDPAHPDAIRTVRGVGYMFVPPKD
jgi:DNA-binding response OmpR family regulator